MSVHWLAFGDFDGVQKLLDDLDRVFEQGLISSPSFGRQVTVASHDPDRRYWPAEEQAEHPKISVRLTGRQIKALQSLYDRESFDKRYGVWR